MHDVALHVASGSTWQAIATLKRYSFELDMLEVEDTFDAELPWDEDLWPLVATDTEVRFSIDQSVVMTGRIDSRTLRVDKAGGAQISIRGRDRGGRLVDESAPLGDFIGIGIQDLAQRMTSPWYGQVLLSNATNRRLLVGPAVRKRARVSAEPAIITDTKHEKKVNPGESRWSVLAEFLRRGRLLGWGAGDGSAFIVGKPNYQQEPQWRFIVPRVAVEPSGQLVRAAVYTEDVANHYAKVACVGESKGTSASYHSNVTRRSGTALDGPAADGTGLWFQAPKKLIIQDADLKSAGEAADWAKRHLAVRRSTVRQLEFEARGHGQGGGIFTFDTMARVHHQLLGWDESWLLTRVRFRGSKADGQMTTIALVPAGTELEIA